MKTRTKNYDFRAMFLSLVSLMVLGNAVAQPSRRALDSLYAKKAQQWDDSVGKLRAAHNPIYLGGSLSLTVPQYVLKSSIAAINGMNVSYIGSNVGGVVANKIGKLKADVGLFYSNPSVPFNMEMTQASLSGSIYILRLANSNRPYHTFEPYTKLSVATQFTKFYGTYLPSQDGTPQSPNYSSTDQPLLNTSRINQVVAGVGVEYQLENCKNQFIHLFAEVTYGLLTTTKANNVAFNNTGITNPTTVSVGINFGIIK